MWKITGWLAKTLAAGLIISFLSVWTTGYIVNSYVETLLKQYNIPIDHRPFALNGVWGGLWGADPAETKETASSESGKSGSTDIQSDGKQENGGTVAGASETDASEGDDTASNPNAAEDTNSGKRKETPPVAVDAFSDLPDGPLTDIGGGTGKRGNSGAVSGTDDAGESAAGEASKDGMAMSKEEINAAKNNMNDADKQTLLTVMKKLPQDAWQQISAKMENGLTNEEMTEVNTLIARYLDKDEYDKMLGILKKY